MKTHGGNKTPEYSTWLGMKARCHNPRSVFYAQYGGRGIRVCEQWQHDFAAFRADVGPRPSMDHSIDRIDNDGHYEPGNVRWATAQEQSRNRACVDKLTWRGETLTISEWADRIGVKYISLFKRLRRGLSLEDAFTLPAGTGRVKRGAAHGNAKLVDASVRDIRHRLTLGETTSSIARSFGVSRRTVRLISLRKKLGHMWWR